MRVPLLTFCLCSLLVGIAPAEESLYVRRVGIFGSLAADVAVRGGYAYLVGDSLFRVISIADPQQPIQVGCVEAPGNQVAVQGDYAYVADGFEGLRIISVADPANPVEVGHFDAKRSIKDVDVDGDYAYVADLDSGLRVISVADPTNPVEVACIDTIDITYAVAVSGDYVYVFGGVLSVFQTSDPEHPVRVGSCGILSWATYGAVSGYYAYVVTYGDGLVVIRVADPTHPVQVWQRDGDYGGVAVHGSRLYVGAKGVKVFSLADPGRPVELGHYTIGGTAGAAGVAADSEYAYVACSWAGLQVYQYFGPGVEESHKPPAVSQRPATTVVRSLPAGAMAYDATGRRVLNPKPGLYFVRSEPPAVGGQPSAVSKVIVTR